MFGSVLNTSVTEMYSDFMLCIASDTFRIIMAYSTLFFRYMPEYSIIFSVIKAYSRTLKHYLGIFTYSYLFWYIKQPV